MDWLGRQDSYQLVAITTHQPRPILLLAKGVSYEIESINIEGVANSFVSK